VGQIVNKVKGHHGASYKVGKKVAVATRLGEGLSEDNEKVIYHSPVEGRKSQKE